MATTTAITTAIKTNSCRWVDGKETARKAIECGSCAILRVQVDAGDPSYYQIGRLGEEWLVGKMSEDGSEPVFYRVNLEWSKTECTCDSCLWGRRKQAKEARNSGKPIEKLFECKHIRFVRNALQAIELI